MTILNIMLGTAVVLYTIAFIVSVFSGKLAGAITCLALTIFQNVIALDFTPVVVQQNPLVTMNPKINIGLIAAILIIIFSRNSHVKNGAWAYLVATVLILLIVLFAMF